MRHALFLPPSGEFADPAVMLDVAVAADENGWDGVFLWDHVLRPADEPQEIFDPWVSLGAIAARTSRVVLGTMVTPPTRRRPVKLARETLTLDHFCNGRLVLGLGLGVDTSGELSKFGEVVDARERGQRLDEASELLQLLWSGERVDYAGDHFVAHDVQLLPRPVQRPRIPMWFAARGDARKPVRRAACHDGLFPVDIDRDKLRAMLDVVADERGSLDGFDVALRPDGDIGYDDLEALGVTWALTSWAPGFSAGRALAIASEPPGPAAYG